SCGFEFECIWHGAIREVLRVIRQYFPRLTKSLITQPGDAFSLAINGARKPASTHLEELSPSHVAESRTRLIVGLARARLQLNLSQHLADTSVIRALTLIDELDANLDRSASRLRASYSSHFPEVCRPSFTNCPCLNDVDLIRLIAKCPFRSLLASAQYSRDLEVCLTQPKMGASIRIAARDSIGCDLLDEDGESLKMFAGKLLKMIQMREHYTDILTRRIESLVPNLYALLKSTLPQSGTTSSDRFNELKLTDTLSASLIAARLIVNAGSLTRLANMPTSRILSLGASKALFRKSGAVAATSTGLLGSASRLTVYSTTERESATTLPLSTFEMKTVSGNRLQPDIVRRRAARLLAAKSSLACKADCFRSHNPSDKQECPHKPAEDPRLASGAFGIELGRSVQNNLRVWAEANGVHVEMTEDQKKVQRERRKKYRKAKRKAWLVRKLSRTATGLRPSMKITEHNQQPIIQRSPKTRSDSGNWTAFESHMTVDMDGNDTSTPPDDKEMMNTTMKNEEDSIKAIPTTRATERSLRSKAKRLTVIS
ncbi:Nucleolar protein 56, partial [Paragonimus heterotremus]